jgi:hypothetical protein
MRILYTSVLVVFQLRSLALRLGTNATTSLAAILDPLPVPFPLSAPRKGPIADNANLLRQIGLGEIDHSKPQLSRRRSEEN